MRLEKDIPSHPAELDDFFSPHLGNLPRKIKGHLGKNAANLKKTLVYRNGLWPMGLMAFCLSHGIRGEKRLGGIYDSVKNSFGSDRDKQLYDKVEKVNQFRNTYVAHTEKEIGDAARAKAALEYWIEVVYDIWSA